LYHLYLSRLRVKLDIKMTAQTFQNILIGIVILAIIGAVLWLNNSYERMKSDCEKMGGSFYSISFNQNICVEGSIVHELN